MADQAQTIDPEIRGEIRDIVEQSLRFGAPGLSDAIRGGIARNIAFKVSHAVCWRPHDQLMAVARRKTESIRAAFGPDHSPDDGEVSFLLRMAERYTASYPAPLAWRPPDTAPSDTEVEVRVGAMTFLAKLVPGGGMNMDGTTCDQWQSTREGEHPPCWSDGCCWASNEDEDPSMPVEAWRPGVAQEAGEFYENAGAPHPKQIKKRDAMAVAWARVLRPYLIGLRDQHDTQARPSAPAQSPSTSDREG